jgi:alpha-L-rhamnosidase
VLVPEDPFVETAEAARRGWSDRAHWPAHWISVEPEPGPPFVAGYRCRFASEAETAVRLHVSADERYELYVDGVLVGRGPDRGDLEHWTFQSYDLTLGGGNHWVAARVWTLAEVAPFAQFSLRHGFLLAAEGRPDLSTGSGPWEAAVLPGHTAIYRSVAWGCGDKLELDGRRYPWGWQQGGDGLTWEPALTVQPAFARRFANDMPANRMLVPSILPPQWEAPFHGGVVRLVSAFPGGETHAIPVRAADSIVEEAEGWQALLGGSPLTVPAGTNRRVLIDLEDYTCAYPVLRLQGGRGSICRVNWQEALFDDDGMKGDRDAIEGKRFRSIDREEDGVGDRFIAGGGDETHTTLWWEAGRFVEVTVETADTPLVIGGLEFLETRYPYEDTSAFASSDDRLDAVRGLAFRTLQMCSHETAMDCPFYEQLQYAGDTRLQLLVAYVTQEDDRLARQALLAFDHSRSSDGLTRSRYPSNVRQTIPPFSLWWVASVHDFSMWRDDPAFVTSLLPGVRAVLDAYRANVDAGGLFHAFDGWNFTDWVGEWEGGAPTGAHWGVSAALNFQLALVADLAAELEEQAGEPELATRDRRLADRVRHAAESTFWSPERGLYADDASKEHWSEHAQCLALLAGASHGAAAVEEAITASGLARTSVYFDHYLFEALARIGRVDYLYERLGLWFDQLADGLRTVVEEPEPTRSDCHAWGAHPVFHLYATLLGVRPAEPGMRAVTVQPQLGPLAWADGTLRTPHGPLRVRADGSGTEVELPDGVRRI